MLFFVTLHQLNQQLYLLKIDTRDIPPQFDIIEAQIIRAPSQQRAIEIAKQRARDEGTWAWETANIEILSPDGPEGVILIQCT